MGDVSVSNLKTWRRKSSAVFLAGFLWSTSLLTTGGALAAKSATADELQRSAIARQIHNVVASSRLDGFTGISLQGTTLVLYWKGNVPLSISQVIAARPAGMQMAVRSARFSLAEMDATERQLVAANTAVFGGKIVWVALPGDYSAVQVGFDATLVDTSALNALQGESASISSPIPVQAVLAQPFTYYGCPPDSCPPRWNDSRPYWGGDVYYANNSYCSTSFEVVVNGTGELSLLTAQHCPNGYSTVTPDSGHRYMGVTCCQPTNSSGVIRLHTGETCCAYGPYVYSDAWNSGISSHTEGASDPYYGQTDVCLSGGFTGQDCANVVTTTNTYLGGTGWGPGFFTTEQVGKGAAGNGDSGGPTYNHAADGGNIAMGVIQGSDQAGNAPCQGFSLPNSNRLCSTHVFSSNISAALSGQNATIAT
jgi:hypothetical protein